MTKITTGVAPIRIESGHYERPALTTEQRIYQKVKNM